MAPARVWLLAPAAFGDPATEAALAQVRQALTGLRPPVSVLEAPAGVAEDTVRLAGWLEAQRPDAVLCLRRMPPRALADLAAARGLPLVLADADIAGWPALPFWQRVTGGRALARLARVMVPDPASRAAALRRGAQPEHVSVTGALTETRPPLRVSEAELSVQAEAVGGRQCWYAVAVPEAEEKAVLDAHHAALGLSHRALLLIQPALAARAPALAARFEESGLHVALRSEVDEPLPEHQVLVLDDPNELGLWYRLAPVCFMGGTLSGDDLAARHPFEPAGLGSAILHGPVLERHADVWRQLERAGATRIVPRASALGDHLAAVMEPERAADLASRAWNVSTGGAAVARQIARVMAGMLAEGR